MVMRYVKVFRSLSKFVLHPLMHTPLKFTLAQNMVSCQRLLPCAMLFFPSNNHGESEVLREKKNPISVLPSEAC